MEIKLNLLEMSFDQRRDTANFLLTYPPAVPLIGIDDRPVKEVDLDELNEIDVKCRRLAEDRITEEQRLDVEQKSDLEEVREIGANLNAIFGAPIPQVPVDKEGLPWDHRIHASTKTFIADGTWKLKRGVDAAEVAMVKEQLKALMCVPTFIPQAPVHNAGHVDYDPATRIPAPPAPVFTPTSVGYVPHVDVATYTPPIPLTNANTVGASTTIAAHGVVTLTDLIARMSSAIVAGKMTQAVVAEMCTKHGVSEFMLLRSRPDLLPLIDADMRALGV